MASGNPAIRQITLTLPAALVQSGGTQTLTLDVLADAQLSGAKRAIERSFEDTNASSPQRRQWAEWNFWGPAGYSFESTSGVLAVDFAQNLDTRWTRRLLPTGAQNDVDLTSDDPPGGEEAIFGEAIFGDVDSPFGGGLSGSDVNCFAEQQGYVLCARGRLLTQVDPANSFAVVSTTVMDAEILDMAFWRGNVYIALGSSVPMKRVVNAASTGLTLETVTSTTPAGDVYAFAVKVGSDRAWIINAEPGSDFNYAVFTLDAFVNLSAPFQVGDPLVSATGIGPFGFDAATMFGFENNFYSFTDQGKPLPLSKALTTHLSALNGKQWADPGWGWNYATSQIGLRAVVSGVDNPVGVGEGMRDFTGHSGIPTAIYPERGELEVAYYTSAGQSYLYRGAFSPQTAGSGQPLLMPWAYESASFVGAWFSTVTGAADQGAWLVRGNGTNLTYTLIADNGRDDLYSSYTYDVGGGVAYLTTLDRNPNLLKTFRLARLRSRNLTSGSTWNVAMGFDVSPTAPTSATYTSIGTITTNGQQTLLPVSGSAPISGISGYTMKPKVTGVFAGSGASATPPELYGTLYVEWDERPDQVEVIEAAVRVGSAGLTDTQLWTYLRQLVGSDVDIPVQFTMPDDLPAAVSTASGGGKSFGFLTAVRNRTDVTDASVEAVTIRIEKWPEAESV